jgi:hypothetical protein
METKDGSTKRKRRQPNPDLVMINLLRHDQRQTGAGWAAQFKFVQKHLKWLQENRDKFEESDNNLAGAVATRKAFTNSRAEEGAAPAPAVLALRFCNALSYERVCC